MEHCVEWCETYQQELAFTETNQLFHDFNRGEESEAEAQAQKPLLSTAPLTPAVCFGSSITTQHLPPPTLPFQRASPSNPARLEEQQEQKVAEEEATRATQEWEAHRDAELKEALSKIQRLEKVSAGQCWWTGANFTHHSGISSRQHYRLNHRTTESGFTLVCKPWTVGSHKGKISDDDIFTSDTFGGRSLNRCTYSSCTFCSC